MRHTTYVFPVVAILSIGMVVGSTPSPAQLPPAHTPSPAPSPAPGATPSAPSAVPAPPPAPPAINAKEIEGLDVFGSDGQQVGKIAKVNVVSGGNVKDVEVQSAGFLGFFSKTYVVPVAKLNKKGGRVELTMTSEEAKQLSK